MSRLPLGVAVLGFFALMSGLTHLLTGIMLVGAVALGPVPTGDGVFLAGAIAIAAGLAYVVVAGAAWFLQPWAYAFGLIMSAFGIFNGILTLILTGSLAYGVASLLFPVIVFWYLNREDVKQAFLGE